MRMRLFFEQRPAQPLSPLARVEARVAEELLVDSVMIESERSGQCENAFVEVLVAAAAKRVPFEQIGHVVAAVIEHAEQPPELPIALIACAQARADLEHRAGI